MEICLPLAGLLSAYIKDVGHQAQLLREGLWALSHRFFQTRCTLQLQALEALVGLYQVALMTKGLEAHLKQFLTHRHLCLHSSPVLSRDGPSLTFHDLGS